MPRLASMLTCVAMLGLAPALAAQRPQSRTGFWYAFGIGDGWARVSCQICKGAHQTGLSAYLRLGGGVSRSLLIGAEMAGWRKSADGVDQTLAGVSAAAYWYPSRRSPLYLKGGVGYLTHRIEDGTDVITSTGFGPQMGMGYERRIGRNLFLAPYFNIAYGSIAGGVKFNGADAQDQATVTLVQLGVALTGH
jgi:hypothetical protein